MNINPFTIIDMFEGGTIFDDAYRSVCRQVNGTLSGKEQLQIAARLLQKGLKKFSFFENPATYEKYTNKEWLVIAKLKIAESIGVLGKYNDTNMAAGLVLAEAVMAVNYGRYSSVSCDIALHIRQEASDKSWQAEKNGGRKHKKNRELKAKVIRFYKDKKLAPPINAALLAREFIATYPADITHLHLKNRERTIADYIRNFIN